MILSACGPDLEKYITAASPYAFDISPDAENGHSVVLFILKDITRSSVVNLNVIRYQLTIFMSI